VCPLVQVIHVIGSMLNSPPLLLHAVYGKEESFDSDFYVKTLNNVLAQYEVARENVVGISSDNTNLMPSFIRKQGFFHIPCIAHVINLALREICTAFGMEELLGLRLFPAHSTQRQEALRRRGINPKVFDTPATRWGYAIPALAVLTEPGVWAVLLRFVEENKPTTVTPNYDSLVAKLRSPFVHACCIMAYALMRRAEPLIREAESGLSQLPQEFLAHLVGYMDLLRLYHFGSNTRDRVKALTLEHNIKLKADELKRLDDWTAYAVEQSMEKLVHHLTDSVVEHADGTATTEFLSVFSRHTFWRRVDVQSLPKPTDYGALKRAVGDDPTDEFIVQYGSFRNLLITGHFSAVPGPEASYADLTSWWDTVRRAPATALVGRAALASFLIPLSNSVVERSFSSTANREMKNRLLAGERYAYNTAMLSCNSELVQQIVTRRGCELAYRLGKHVPTGVFQK
jgi:hypothetical protein